MIQDDGELNNSTNCSFPCGLGNICFCTYKSCGIFYRKNGKWKPEIILNCGAVTCDYNPSYSLFCYAPCSKNKTLHIIKVDEKKKLGLKFF